MKKETNVKRTGCYIRRQRAFPLERWGAEKGWQMVTEQSAMWMRPAVSLRSRKTGRKILLPG